jgi:hypothetical protein
VKHKQRRYIMNKTLKTTLIVITVLVLAGGAYFAGSVVASGNARGPFMMSGYGWNNNNTDGPGMMRNGNNNNQSNYGYGSGMMNGRGGSGMMGGTGNRNNGGYGPGMMGGTGYNNGSGMMNGFGSNAGNLTPLTVEQAKAAAEKYLSNLNNSDLQIAEVMIFDNNAYVVIKEISTGNGAFELLVDPSSQIAYPEHGPNMMWNVKYIGNNHTNMMGGNGGMMGGNGGAGTTPANTTVEMNITSEQSIEYAQKYLDANISGATAATDPITFHGYYTLDYEVNGKVAGMLSVNGYSGQIFLHTWHGTFIEESAMQ